MLHVIGKDSCVRSKTDEDEQASRGEIASLVRPDVVKLERREEAIGVALRALDGRVPDDFDLGILEQTLLENLG